MRLNTTLARTSRGVQRTFSALQSRNYRLWFGGQLVSLVGTWMQTTAQGYLVYELTKSPAFLGYVGFAAGVPAWVFTMFSGAIADRMPRRTMLLFTQAAMMILAFILAGLVFTKRVQPWHIVVLALALGTANAFDAPPRQAFVVDLVETGRTLRENGLHPVEEWLHVAPYLIANRAAYFMRRDEIRALRRTLGGGS